nr:MAG TPA: hypothetical protein [Caudoviricetes sp.]DAJ55608.1 MAG TPA: hypothetical protein [Caudoviricetes sp.]
MHDCTRLSPQQSCTYFLCPKGGQHESQDR